MTAFLLGAGLGMRLRPLTEHCPKPLLPVCGRPLITYAMDHCLTVGVGRFIVNTHHCPEAYDRAFPERRWQGKPILFCHEPILLDTAGGLKNIESHLSEGETFLVYNGDILSDLPLRRLLQAHAASGREVTLVLRSGGPLLNVAVDGSGAVCDLRGLLGNPGVRRCLFTGIYAVEKRLLRRLTAGKVESVIPVFAEMIRESPGAVGGIVIDDGLWQDIGDPLTYTRIRYGAPLRYERPEAPPSRGAAEGLPAAPGKNPDGGRGDEPPAFVRAALSLPAHACMTFTPAGGGGSDRDYFRVAVPGAGSWILMRYGLSREENTLYADIARFLREIGVTVPVVFGHDPRRGLLLMEDLGGEDLFAFRGAPWAVRRGLYEKSLALASRLHAFPLPRFPAVAVRLMPGFGPELYRWERDYFREQYVGKICRIILSGSEEAALERELADLAGRLMGTVQTLVHRDLQSQNVMVRAGEPVFIDFQGMRTGSPFYDLGSLLWDPYVEFSDRERDTLLRHYFDLSRPLWGWAEFQELFCLASAERLMQALGAYGFLGAQAGKTHFLAHIPAAVNRLIEVAHRAGSLPLLRGLAVRCRDSR